MVLSNRNVVFLDDFLSDDLEIMVTAENIQSDFRGASYSQSQILIQGEIDTTDFLDGNYELQYAKQVQKIKDLTMMGT